MSSHARRLTIFVLAFIVGFLITLLCCVSPSTPAHISDPVLPGIRVDVYDASLEAYAPLWEKELGRRFKAGPVDALLLHGGSVIHNQWVVEDNPGGGYAETCEAALTFVDRAHAQNPDKIIVLLACNVDHIVIHGRPWLYYSPGLVFCVPDRATIPAMDDGNNLTDMHIHLPAYPSALDNRWSGPNSDAIGNAFELVNGG